MEEGEKTKFEKRDAVYGLSKVYEKRGRRKKTAKKSKEEEEEE